MATKSSPNLALSLAFWILHVSLLTLLFMPMQGIAVTYPNIDKIVHVLLFVPVSIVTYLYLRGSKFPIFVGLSFYAFLLEVGQELYTNTRFFEWMDWLLGTVGIAMGLLILTILHLLKK